MSVSSIINKATGKIFDDLIPQGGGIPLTKGQLISADGLGNEVAVPVGANGTILSADSTQDDGLRWIAVPGATPLAQGQLLSADVNGDATVVPAPNLPAQANYVLSADATAPTNLLWKPATGGGGLLVANAPLFDDDTQNPNRIGIDFTAVKAEIPAGTGVAKVGALIPPPAFDGYVLRGDAGEATGLSWSAVTDCFSASQPLLLDENQPGDPFISIAFTAVKGEIPAGTGTSSVGDLVPAPTANNQVLISDATTTTGLKWQAIGGSGSITGTFPIVETAGGSNESIISIGFANKGELAVGSGVSAGAGLILPPPLEDNYVLSSYATAPTGMRWVANTPSGSTQVIARSTTASTAVANPTSTQDTLILVAEDPDGSWDARPNPADPNDKDPYNLDATTQFVLISGTNVSLVAYVAYVNNQRCIDLHILTNTDDIPVGLLYQYDYLSPAFVAGVNEPIPAGTGLSVFENSFLVYGSFNRFHQAGPNPPPDIEVWSACLIDCDGASAGNIVIVPINDFANPSLDIRGFTNTNGLNLDPIVYKVLWNQTANLMWYFGYFTGFATGQGQGSGSIDGYNSMVVQNTTTGGYSTAGNMAGSGLGVSIDGQPTSIQGFILDAVLSADATQLYIVGSWNFTQNIDATWTASTQTGFGYYNSTLGTNRWSSTPASPLIAQGVCIRPSLSQANKLIVVSAVSSAPPYFYDTTANTITGATGAIPLSPNEAYVNCVAGSPAIDIGTGVGAYDFVLYQDKGDGIMYVIWFSTPTALVAQSLTPSPTGLKPLFIPVAFPPTYTGGYQGLPLYGIKLGLSPAPFVEVMATSAIYKYDPVAHGALDFVGNFFYNGQLKNPARFSAPSPPYLGNESQSYVASTSLKAWIQTGAKTDGLTYLPP